MKFICEQSVYGSILIYSLKADLHNGKLSMVNDVTIRIENANGSKHDLTAIASKIMSAVNGIQPTLSDALELPEIKALVEAAFNEGFLAGTQDGWINNPRMEKAWKHSRTLAALTEKE